MFHPGPDATLLTIKFRNILPIHVKLIAEMQ